MEARDLTFQWVSSLPKVNGNIPKVVFMSWKRKTNLPPELEKTTREVKRLNPGYYVIIFDDEDCKDFLYTYLGDDYVDAFEKVIPGAFKCDLWRYAILYFFGGIYLDMDLYPLKSLDEIFELKGSSPTSWWDITLWSCADRKKYDFIPRCAIFQAFLACAPKHEAMKEAMELSYHNIFTSKEVYRETLFDITGPVVMGRAINRYRSKPDLSDLSTGAIPFSPSLSDEAMILFRHEEEGKYILNLDHIPIFLTKVEGYDPEDAYGKVSVFYRSKS